MTDVTRGGDGDCRPQRVSSVSVGGRGKWICTALARGGSVSYTKYDTQKPFDTQKESRPHTYHTRGVVQFFAPEVASARERVERKLPNRNSSARRRTWKKTSGSIRNITSR